MSPFTEAQEARIREIVAEELRRRDREDAKYLSRLTEVVDASRPGGAQDVQ